MGGAVALVSLMSTALLLLLAVVMLAVWAV
jgi:hypothetical protein